MWRSRSLEEWERKKSYLIRSLFEDRSVLSPILEEYEQTSPSSPSHFIYRAESPLPELIIEVEPKKPNPHDEPDELYNELAKEMRRLYRKDYLDIDLSTSSPENSSSESLNRGRIYDIISDGSNSNDVSALPIGNDIDSPTHTENSNSKGSSESISRASESVIVQRDVYSPEYDFQEELVSEQQCLTKSKKYRQSADDLISVPKAIVAIKSTEGEDEEIDKTEGTDSQFLAKDTDASSKDSSSESSVNISHASPEIMRQRQHFASLGTPPRHTVSKSDSSISKTMHLSMEVDSKEYSEDILDSNQEGDIVERSGNETFLFVTSTPTRKRASTRFSTETGHKRRLVSYSSSSSFASAANAALQTSFSDCETDWSFFWSNFFVGIPTVYTVCSCSDHICTT